MCFLRTLFPKLAGNVGRMSADVGGKKTHTGTRVGRMSAVMLQASSCSINRTLQKTNVGGTSAGADINFAHFQGLQCYTRARHNGSSKILLAPSQASRLAVTMDAAATQTCFLCGEDHSQDAAGRSWGRKFECRQCQTLHTLVHRRVGADTIQHFSAEERNRFSAKAKSTASNGRYSWETVRSVIIDRATSQRITEKGNNVFSESKPVSVWLTQGYTSEQLEKCPRWTCPALGEVVKVPVHQDWVKQLHREIQEQIVEKERALKEAQQSKKRKSAPASADGGPPSVQDAEAELDVPKAAPAHASTPGARKAAKTQSSGPSGPSGRQLQQQKKKPRSSTAGKRLWLPRQSLCCTRCSKARGTLPTSVCAS